MAKLTKHYFSSLLRSVRPRVQPDKIFVDRLASQLQLRANMLTNRSEPIVRHTNWFRKWLMLAPLVGAGAVAVMVLWLQSPATPLTGYIQKGPFISGSTITIQELDKQLQPTGKTYQVTTASDFGDYRLDHNISSDYVEVIAEGYYFNEVSGTLSVAPLTLRAIADVSEENVVNVNVLTSLISGRIRHMVNVDEVDFTTAKQIAEQEVLTIFQITAPDIADFETMNISQEGTENGVLLAVSVLLQGQQSVAELSELLSKLNLAFRTDGVIESDGPLLQTIRDNADALNTSQIKQNLKNRYSELGIESTIPPFSNFIQPFISSADPLGYRITLMDNVFGVNRTPGATIRVTISGNGFVEGKEVVSLKETVTATAVEYIDDHTLVAELPIENLAAGSYTVVVRNADTGRLGVTDGFPIETESTDVEQNRFILRGYTPTITSLAGTVSYLNGGTVEIHGSNFAYGTFVWINGWQVPNDAIRVANDQLILVDLSPALIANNTSLPRKTDLIITVQTPDFQEAAYSGFRIQ